MQILKMQANLLKYPHYFTELKILKDARKEYIHQLLDALMK